jgi:hypothetical protein
VFKREANKVFAELCGLLPADLNLKLVLNQSAPRRGAFEIAVAKTAEDEKTSIWSGLAKGKSTNLTY